MAFTLKSISIVGGKIKFTIPKGTNLVFKIVGQNGRTYFVSDKELSLSVPLIIGENANNTSWAPISGVFSLFKYGIHGKNKKMVNYDYENVYLNNAQFYAKVGDFKENITTDNTTYHSIYNASKLGIVILNSKRKNDQFGNGTYEGTTFIEDIDCEDDSYQDAKSAINFQIKNGRYVTVVSNNKKTVTAADGSGNNTSTEQSSVTAADGSSNNTSAEQSSAEPDVPKNAQQAIAVVSKYNKGKGWIVGARESKWPEEKIQAYRNVINNYYNQKKVNQARIQATANTDAQRQPATGQEVTTTELQGVAQPRPKYDTDFHQQLMNGPLKLNRQPLQPDRVATQQTGQTAQQQTSQTIQQQQRQARQQQRQQQRQARQQQRQERQSLAQKQKQERQRLRQQQRQNINNQQIVKEIRDRFYDIFNRMNNATILQ